MPSFAIFITIVATSCGHAQVNQLFTLDQNREPVMSENYSQIMEQVLKDGSGIITLSNSKEYTLTRFLGAGRTNIIFELEDGRAIRLGYSADGSYPDAQSVRFMHRFRRGYNVLWEAGINIPFLYIADSLKREAVITDKITGILFDLKAVFSKQPSFVSQSESTKKLAIEKLRSFQKQLMKFEEIGDFHKKQLVYNGEWILIDWGDGSRLAQSPTVKSNHYIHIEQALTSYENLSPSGSSRLEKIEKTQKDCSSFFGAISKLLK